MPLVIIEGPGIDPMRIDASAGGALADLCVDVTGEELAVRIVDRVQ